MTPSKNNFLNESRLTVDKISDEGCLNILEMFLSQLAEDYHFILEDFILNQTDKKVRKNFKQIRRFILSDYFAMLTGIDGHDIIGALDGEYKSVLEVYEWAKI